MKPNRTLPTLVLLLAVSALTPAQDAPPVTFSTEFVVGFPLLSGVFTSAYPGVKFEYDFSPSPWGLEFGYAFHSRSDYRYSHSQDQWSGPLEPGTGTGDTLFYQTKHVLSPGLVHLWRHGAIDLKTSVGVLAQLTFASEAYDYYPDYKERFEQEQAGRETLLGNYWKFGFDWRPLPLLNLGTDFAFEIPHWGAFLNAVPGDLYAYARTNAHIEVHLGVKL